MKKYSLSALVAAGVLAGGMATSASAADLGGNCCADLEERIAELEATTARKGNRKVSLTVSGWVGQQITFWDDGGESNVYIHDLGSTLGSHVKFTGSATIVPGWSAGYVLHIEAMSSDGLTTNQNVDNGPSILPIVNGGTPGAQAVQTMQSFWFIKSDQLGKVSLGLQSQASDNTAILVDGSGSLVPANWVSFDINSFFIRNSATGVLTATTWSGAGGCVWGDCNGVPTNSIRYDSPTFGGFSVSASWGEDDFWDIAGRWSGEHSGFKLAIAAAYSETASGELGNPVQAGNTDYFQIGGYVEHVASGLFVYSAYGNLDFNTAGVASNDTFYIKGGIRQKWNPLGHTVLYGEYLKANNDAANTDVRMWGLGAVQEVDAAAMSIWIKYRNMDASLAVPTDQLDYVGVGALINF